jgi:hypothetical protein
MDFNELAEALRPVKLPNMEDYHTARINALTSRLDENTELLKALRVTMKNLYIHMFNNQGKLNEVGLDWHNVMILIEQLDEVLKDE